MFRRQIRVAQRRAYTSTATPKVALALVAELRKQTQVSISKAREALIHSNGNIAGALEWLQTDLVTTGASKAAKVAYRDTKEGLVAVSVLSPRPGGTFGRVRAAMIELNCETDFVGRNELFASLAKKIAHSAAFFPEPTSVETPAEFPSFIPIPLKELEEAPLLTFSKSGASATTVSSAIRDAIVKVGENITLGRAAAIVEDTAITPRSKYRVCRLGSYVHGALHEVSCGQIGTLALINLHSDNLPLLRRQESFRNELAILERSIACQIVGFDTLSIKPTSQNEVEEQALYSQPFIALPGEFNSLPVEVALQQWSIRHGLVSAEGEGGIDVVRFLRWKAGETTCL
jgi:elongation factor Ts